MSDSSYDATGVHPVVVIGAGPAGLSLADALKRRGLTVPILEKAEAAADSWRRMPESMMLNSPVGVNVLGDTRVGFFERTHVWNRGQYYRYLLEFAEQKKLDIRYRQEVVGIDRDSSGHFEIRTPETVLRARIVVNATGYFCEPVVPERPGDDTTQIPCFTVPQYHSSEAFGRRLAGDRRRVLIVGARITAGQLGVELHEAGFQVTISHREPLAFGLPRVVQRLGFRLYYPYESIRLRSLDFAKRDSGHPMQGGITKKLIQTGEIETRPDIEAFEDARVRFVDGRCEPFDGLIWATGYRPVMQHLGGSIKLDDETGLPELKEMESVAVSNLYFLGLDQQVDYTSRMLRGIRRDAKWLASRLEERVKDVEGRFRE